MTAAYPIINETFIGKKASYPLIRRKVWKTDLVTYDSSLEQTNELWATPVRFWGIQYKHLSLAQRDKLLELFSASRGQARQLYLSEPLDYLSTCTWIQSNYAIITANQSDNYFKISGQHASEFLEDWKLTVSGGANAGIYTVTEATQDASYTYIYVNETLPSGTVGGTILRMYFQLYQIYYVSTAYTWNEAKKDIVEDQCVVTVAGSPQTEGDQYTLTDTEGIIMFASDHVPAAGVSISATFQFYYRVRFTSDQFEDSNLNYKFYEVDIIWLREIKRYSSEAT